MTWIYPWNHTVRINDKAITFVTGLILLLGVGTFVHKGDELFAPKAGTIKIASADADFMPSTDVFLSPKMPAIVQKAENLDIAQVLPPKMHDISGLELVRGTRTASALATPQKYGTLEIDPIQIDCSINLTAKPLRGARIKLELVAPCHKNKVATITHVSLRFNEIVDDSGMITIIIPVLSDPANIEVSFADGISKSISTPVKDLSSAQRTVIAWSGNIDLQLHVDENAFDVSQSKEITTLSARSYKESYLQGGGYLTTLGNADVENGKFIQIYSTDNPNEMFVDFTVVINSPNNWCGAKFLIKTVRYTVDLGPQFASKNVSVRNCSAKNESIVLKNMLRNLIVAQRN
jgi:hypothetical protein